MFHRFSSRARGNYGLGLGADSCPGDRARRLKSGKDADVDFDRRLASAVFERECNQCIREAELCVGVRCRKPAFVGNLCQLSDVVDDLILR